MTNERFATEPNPASLTDASTVDANPADANPAGANPAGVNLTDMAASAPVAEVTARFYLDQIMARVGVDGLVTALGSPGLLAVIDQHAAAVRESLAAAGRFIEPVSLAGYARSVLAVAQRHGRELPDGADLDWSTAEWYVLRLVAVCSLADHADCF